MMNAPSERRETSIHRFAIAAFMLAYIASGFFGGSGYDTARDVAQAFAIRHGHAFPLHGPLLAGAIYLGPIWFYLLALPLAIHESWLAPAVFVAILGSLQFPLAYVTGRRLLDRRFGLLWTALLALPGWGSFELMGFGHTNAVRVCSMLVLYALVRLAQERRPAWLLLASAAMTLALHAHPTTVAYVPMIAAFALFALRDPRTLIGWGLASLAVALLPFAPLVIEQLVAPSGLLRQAEDAVSGMVGPDNLTHIPALLYALVVRGPRVIADSFLEWAPGAAPAFQTAIVGLELAAGVGLVLAVRAYPRALVTTAAAVTVVVVGIVAWMRPSTSFYMTYAMLPPLAGLAALGLHRLCALAGSQSSSVAGTLVATVLALHVATVAGIARAITSGGVAMPSITRLDITHDDPTPPLPEPWLPAYAVDESGNLLCAETGPVVLHATYAYLENTYFGLDHRLHCGARNITLTGRAPATASHLVGLAKPQWSALGWQPSTIVGGLGIASAAQVLSPEQGYAVPDGSIYPPFKRPQAPSRTLTLNAESGAGEALVIGMPYYIWMPPAALKVEANGEPLLPTARDAISTVYACRRCAADNGVKWRIEIDSVAPEWIDVVTVGPTPPPRR